MLRSRNGYIPTGMSDDAYGPEWATYEALRSSKGLGLGATFTSIGWDGSKYCVQRQGRCGDEVTCVTMVSSSTPWAVKSEIVQWHSLMDRTIENFGSPAGAWTPVQIEDATEFWTAHCTTELVRMAALICLPPSTTSLDARATKASMIGLLVAAEIQMCPPCIYTCEVV
jgi:hypothetical protein